MTKILIAAACMGMGLSTAGACEFMQSAHSHSEKTVVASVATEDDKAMSQPVILPPDEALPEEAAE
jgi:hypothetical protein